MVAVALSIVIPTFNEADRLGAGLDRLAAAARDGAVDLAATELLIVDDGSTDATASVARTIESRFPNARVLAFPRNRGKGAAVRAGLLAASGDAVVYCDADMAIDPAHLPSLLDALERAPVAVGTRAVRGRVEYGSALRTGAGRAFNLAVRTLGHVRLDDTQCGFKGLRRGPALLLANLLTTDGYAFDVELLWLAERLGLEVATVEVTWLDVAGSTVRVARDSARMLRDVVAARRRGRWVAAATAPDDARAHDRAGATAPPGTVLVRGGGTALLVAGVAALGALRACVGDDAAVRLVELDELAGLAPLEVVPA